MKLMNWLRISLYVGRQAQTMTVLRWILLQIIALVIDTKKGLESHADETSDNELLYACDEIWVCKRMLHEGSPWARRWNCFSDVHKRQSTSRKLTFLPKGKWTTKWFYFDATNSKWKSYEPAEWVVQCRGWSQRSLKWWMQYRNRCSGPESLDSSTSSVERSWEFLPVNRQYTRPESKH